MDTIFFEKQIARLCAQHALNMLLQNSIFEVGHLATFARELDENERCLLGSDARANFQGQNMDDSGFFSIQVIQAALRQVNLTAVSIDRSSQADKKADPSLGRAYICNLDNHWFTIRRFGHNNWFILDSVKNGPKKISANYLSHYFAQCSSEGYSIFVIEGDLPVCGADFTEFDAPSQVSTASPSSGTKISHTDDDDEIMRAIELSKKEMGGCSKSSALSSNEPAPFDDDDMNRAIELSRKEIIGSSYATAEEEQKMRRLEEEENMLKEAIRQSLEEIQQLETSSTQNSDNSLATIFNFTNLLNSVENENATAPIDLNELRQRRAKFLDSFEKK